MGYYYGIYVSFIVVTYLLLRGRIRILNEPVGKIAFWSAAFIGLLTPFTFISSNLVTASIVYVALAVVATVALRSYQLKGQATSNNESTNEGSPSTSIVLNEDINKELMVEQNSTHERKQVEQVEGIQVEEIQVDKEKAEEIQAEEIQVEEIQAEEIQVEEIQAEEIQVEEIQVEEIQVEEKQVEDKQVEEKQEEQPVVIILEGKQPEEMIIDNKLIEQTQAPTTIHSPEQELPEQPKAPTKKLEEIKEYELFNVIDDLLKEKSLRRYENAIIIAKRLQHSTVLPNHMRQMVTYELADLFLEKADYESALEQLYTVYKIGRPSKDVLKETDYRIERIKTVKGLLDKHKKPPMPWSSIPRLILIKAEEKLASKIIK